MEGDVPYNVRWHHLEESLVSATYFYRLEERCRFRKSWKIRIIEQELSDTLV